MPTPQADDNAPRTVASGIPRGGLPALIHALAPGDVEALRHGANVIADWPAVCSVIIEVCQEQVGRAPIRVLAGTPRATPSASRLEIELRDHEATIGTLCVVFDESEFVEPELPRLCETAALLLSGVAVRVRLVTMLLDAQSYEVAGRIAADFAHDFNNMLTGIIGNAAVLRLLLEADARAIVPVIRIEEAVTSAAHLAHALLNFVRGTMERAPVSINELATVTQHVMTRAIRDDISVALDLAPDVPEVDGEQPLLQRALVNLVMNAVESIDGGGSVIIRTRRLDEVPATALGEATAAASYAAISVTDTGGGIRAGDLSEVFRPFFSTKGAAGTGLGLASVAQVARRHGGAVSVESPRGLGATPTGLRSGVGAQHRSRWWAAGGVTEARKRPRWRGRNGRLAREVQIGWGSGIRTPTDGFRVRCPTIRRIPSSGSSLTTDAPLRRSGEMPRPERSDRGPDRRRCRPHALDARLAAHD